MTVTTQSAAPAPPPFTPPLLLTIRFSTSLPDIELDITAPRSTTVLSLKHLLRNRLGTRSRLRLIHHGRLLADSAALSAALKSPPPPPPSSDARDGSNPTPTDPKGKAVAGVEPVRRIYVNCHIGDELTDEELAAEREAADKPPEDDGSADGAGTTTQPPTTTRPRPRGFDRLTGFSASEISTLRTQFAVIHRDRLAQDGVLPSPDTMRRFEDAWIDNNANGIPIGDGTGQTAGLEDDITNMAHILDILIRAMMIGFFFPLGSLTWLLRQGIWSERWQIFVGSGVVFSITIGVVMSVSTDR
ncbi:DUF2407 C-terminal domain-containing protein [Stachybotrys elegans]|uniref:DUF2407 C-terminal domain-containing protein n=1 Tax=Stachybotrys elegans TaxID=80388 RepID=A0A8K0SSI8_9HYPO|nr:DUF2407 C-terminal domain-containing protein [Stachybotrys elegans]